MIDFGGKIYYIDFNSIDMIVSGDKSLKPQKVTDTETTIVYDEKDKITGKQVTTSIYHKGKEMDASKYDVLRLMLEIVLKGDDEINGDDALGTDRIFKKAPLSFKLAFNTLMKYGILKELEITDED